jgi:hypothetical protein
MMETCIKKTRPWVVILILSFLSYLPAVLFSQHTEDGQRVRENFPDVKTPGMTTAPTGYCPSMGGSTTWENISNVNVVEKVGNLLEITVDVYISNPSGCVSGQPCPEYDSSPEYVNVWIDWDGDEIWEEHEKIKALDQALTGYGNINYRGTMTAKATISIPPNAVRPTWLRANLGWGYDPNDPCELNWTYGNVVDQQVLWNLRVLELASEKDIQLPVFPGLQWQGVYDASGNLLNSIADTVIATMKNSFFLLPVQLISIPGNLGNDARVKCQWEVLDGGTVTSNYTASFTGKTGRVKIVVPQKIGFYDLKLRFIFKNDKNSIIGEQLLTVPLWVIYDKPTTAVENKRWLEKAITWTKGAATPDEMALKLMNGIYQQSGWQYFTYYFNWKKLFTGEESGGNCGVNRTVWLNLLKVLGVGGAIPIGHKGRKDKGFMANPGYVAIGNLSTKNGNARQVLSLFYDRWVFDSHFFGNLGNTFYDPTFNLTHPGNDKYFHIDYDIVEVNGILIGLQHNQLESVRIYTNGQFGAEGGYWAAYIYKYLTSDNNQFPATPLSLSSGANFTGSYTEETVDEEGDGLFNQLGATVGVEVTDPAEYSVLGYLRKDDSTLTSRPLYFSASAWSETVGPNTGTYDIMPLFSGEEIFLHALDGPYTMDMVIIDSSGALVDTVSFSTAGYSYTDFGELPGRLQQLSESAQDTTSNGLFDEIDVAVQLETSLAGTYAFESVLQIQDQTIASTSGIMALNTGSNIGHLSIPGTAIAAAGMDGPYMLSIQVLDEGGEQNIFQEIQTTAYQASQFAPPVIRIIGGVSDTGIDIDANGLFDSLEVTLSLESDQSINATLSAWLENAGGESITWAERSFAANGGNQTIQLRFAGVDIHASQFDGPYHLGYTTIINDSSDVILNSSDYYETQAYQAGQFEAAEPPLIITTGNYSENTIDADNNGLFDSLAISIEVFPRDSGNVVALGQLVDGEGETILWASTVQFLHENMAQTLALTFDGRFIYGGLTDGPYYLRDLLVYHVGDPTQSVDITEAYTTQFYQWQNFEPAAVITGTVTDSTGRELPNVFLIVEGQDNDYTNQAGLYNLVLLADGDYLLKIEDPDSLDLEWSIYVDNNFIYRGDSVQVSANIGQIIQVDFVAPIIITALNEPSLHSALPEDFRLIQNYPNPFNPGTTIEYSLPRASDVKLIIYDIIGREIQTLVNERQSAGQYRVSFDASNLSSGIYLYRIQASDPESSSGQDFSDIKKMILMK